MELFKERMKAARERLGWAQEALAREADVSLQTIRRYESRKEPFERKTSELKKVAAAAGVHTSWLNNGEGEMLLPGQGDGAKEKPAPQEEAGEQKDEVQAVIFGEANAAGELVLAPEDGKHPKMRSVSRAKWRADFGDGVPYGASSHGYWLVRGDSAAPLYFSGEEVPVRKVGPTQEFEPEGVYIFRWNDNLYLKRLFDEDGTVYAQSLNPGVRDMRFRPGNGHEFAVLAKVCTTTKQELFISLLGSKLEPNR